MQMTDDGKFIRSLFHRQASINILALAVSTLAPITCMILVGTRFGSDGLAIIALCSPLFLGASFFGFLFAGGGQIVCAGFIAADDMKGVNKVYSAVLALTTAVGLAVCAGMFIFRGSILAFIALEVTPALTAYFNYFILYVFFTILGYVPIFFARTAGREGLGLLFSGTLTVVGIGTSVLFLQFMGIEAVALGQALGTAAGFVAVMYKLRANFTLVFPKALFLKKILAAGSTSGLKRLYIVLMTFVFNALFLRAGGNEAVALFGVVFMLHRFIGSGLAGTAQTLIPLVGVLHKEQDVTSIRQTVKTAFGYGNGLILALCVLAMVFNAQIVQLFGLPPDSGFGAIIPIYSIYALLLLNGMIFTAYYNATQQLTLANAIPLFQECLLVCAGAYVMSVLFGVSGIWWALPVSGALSMLLVLAFLIAAKVDNKELSFLLLQSNRHEKEGRYISFSVTNDLKEAGEAAAKVSDFCEENGISLKQTMQISMAVEEILTLIINHNTQKNLSVSVRLFILDGSIILRFRNTGDKFDALAYYKAHITADFEKNLEIVGMKYIVEASNVVYYRQTFGVNSLVVVI